MSSRYRVKFKLGRDVKYGIAEHYSEEAKELAKQGKLLVSDAILPRTYEVLDADAEVIPFGKYVHDKESQSGGFDDEYSRYVQEAWKTAFALSEALVGLVKGKLLREVVGDGYAYYVVTKAGKKTSEIEWRGFCEDRWVSRHFGWGPERFPNHMLEPFIMRTWSKL